MANATLDPVAAWFWRLVYNGRVRRHRRFYARYIAEEPRTIDQRVAFHLRHLRLYWSRCIGFLEACRPVGPRFLAGDWMITILVGTHAATPDVMQYCREHGATALRAAWARYARAVVRARSGLPDSETALESAAAVYVHVQQAYRSARRHGRT